MVCLAFLSLFIMQQSPHKMLWSLRAGMPCNNKPKFTINNVSQRPSPSLLAAAAVGHKQGTSRPPGTWQHGWSGRWVSLPQAPCSAQANPVCATGPTTEVLLVPFMLLVPLQRAGGRKPGPLLVSWVTAPGGRFISKASRQCCHTGGLSHFFWHSAIPFHLHVHC